MIRILTPPHSRSSRWARWPLPGLDVMVEEPAEEESR